MKNLESIIERETLPNFLQSQMDFLCEYEWIFNFKVTDILVDRVKARIPPDWLSYLSTTSTSQFNQTFFPCSTSNNCFIPESVKKFLKFLEQLKIAYRKHPRSSAIISQDLRKGMSPKKHHEVVQFSDLILSVCSREDLSAVMDIGSGVGYLGSALTRLGISVTGVEGCEGHVNNAESRRAKNKNNFPTVNIKVDSSGECAEQLEKQCKEEVALVGLHCCGDLSADLIKVFGKVERGKCLMLVSCCYHKMGVREGGGFYNFPLSLGLKEVVGENLKFKKLLNVPTLRLGAQETVARWREMSDEEHEQHMRNVGYRAVLQGFASKVGVELRKKGRRGVNQKAFQNFKAFLEAVPLTYELEDRALENLALMRNLHEEHEEEFRIFELLTGLQFLLQSVIENLILLDRIQFIKESYGDSVNIELLEIFNDDLSPRNKVMIVTKC